MVKVLHFQYYTVTYNLLMMQSRTQRQIMHSPGQLKQILVTVLGMFLRCKTEAD
jgi:hypothetical protein